MLKTFLLSFITTFACFENLFLNKLMHKLANSLTLIVSGPLTFVIQDFLFLELNQKLINSPISSL